jgi:hypothetical protein
MVLASGKGLLSDGIIAVGASIREKHYFNRKETKHKAGLSLSLLQLTLSSH